MRTAVVETDPVTDGAYCVQEVAPQAEEPLDLRKGLFNYIRLLQAVGCDELLLQPVAADQCRDLATGKTTPLSDLSRNSCVTQPKVPNQVIRACSNALAAVVTLPDRDKCQPNSSRVWQSMARASVALPSRPAQTRHMSVDQRSFGAWATDETASMRVPMPIVRLRTHCPAGACAACCREGASP